MSFVFAILLGVYAFLRALLWMRGQVRLRLHAHELPALPEARSSPDHLSPELRLFFEHSARTLTALIAQRRHIMSVRLSDPDERFGYLRDARYRRAVIEAEYLLREWMNNTTAFFSHRGHGDAESWPASPICAQSALGSVARHAHLARHTRALEPFALVEVERLERALASFSDKLRVTLELLTNAPSVSYRNAALGSQVGGSFPLRTHEVVCTQRRDP